MNVFVCYLALIEEGYHSSNPYHNAVHAADVTQAMHCYLLENKVNNLCVHSITMETIKPCCQLWHFKIIMQFAVTTCTCFTMLIVVLFSAVGAKSHTAGEDDRSALRNHPWPWPSRGQPVVSDRHKQSACWPLRRKFIHSGQLANRKNVYKYLSRSDFQSPASSFGKSESGVWSGFSV